METNKAKILAYNIGFDDAILFNKKRGKVLFFNDVALEGEYERGFAEGSKENESI